MSKYLQVHNLLVNLNSDLSLKNRLIERLVEFDVDLFLQLATPLSEFDKKPERLEKFPNGGFADPIFLINLFPPKLVPTRLRGIRIRVDEWNEIVDHLNNGHLIDAIKVLRYAMRGVEPPVCLKEAKDMLESIYNRVPR